MLITVVSFSPFANYSIDSTGPSVAGSGVNGAFNVGAMFDLTGHCSF